MTEDLQHDRKNLRSRRRRVSRVGLAAWLMALAMALTGCGVPIASSDSVAISSAAGGVYDDSVLHQVHVDVDESAFETMVATYADSGEKEW